MTIIVRTVYRFEVVDASPRPGVDPVRYASEGVDQAKARTKAEAVRAKLEAKHHDPSRFTLSCSVLPTSPDPIWMED